MRYSPIKTMVFLALFFHKSSSAPTKTEERQQKSLPYFDYFQPGIIDQLYNNFNPQDVDYGAMDLDENSLSRTIPPGKRTQAFNSPIYYIRMPPQPYMFVPGLGYVSQPPPPPSMSQFINLPVSFVSNGKPATIYQWANFPNVAQSIVPKKTRPQIHKPADSSVHKLPGKYEFNGKPDDIFVLRDDDYNSIYSDVLQNFYP